MNWIKTLLICLAILLAGGAITMLIFSTEPTASRSGATKETAMLVEVTNAQRGDFQPEIVSTGSVRPAKDIILSPRVAGEVISRSEAFTPGGFVHKGQTLLQIDPADYENTIQLRKSDLEQAKADLNIEMGRQDIARQGYELVGETLAVKNKALVLREPQLNAVKARIKAAEASVKQAELELQRTAVKAPFNAHVLSQNVNVGSQMSPGDNLGRLVGVDTYWIEANVPLSKLRWLTFPGNGHGKGAEVIIKNRTAWHEEDYRVGHLFRLIGSLENQTRLARVLVSVQDPLAQRRRSVDLPELIIGSFVEVSIKAKELKDVVRLNRDYIRKDDTVWIMEDGQLKIQEVDIIFRDKQYGYIASGLSEKDNVVMTNLTTVVNGARLRTEGMPAESPADTTASATEPNESLSPQSLK